MSTGNHLALVVQVKDRLVANGQTFTTNCDAFQITARVAWQLRAHGAQLIRKSGGQNGCDWLGQKYSHDALAFPDGWVDLLSNAGPPANGNTPVWQWTPGAAPNPASVADPFDLDAGAVIPVIPVIPVTPVEPPAPGGSLAELQWQVAVLTQTVDRLAERVELQRVVIEHVALVQARGLSGTVGNYLKLTVLPIAP